MTVAELLRDKYAEECEDGLYLTFHEDGNIYGGDFRDDFLADTFGGRDIASYTYIYGGIEEPDELAIDLK